MIKSTKRQRPSLKAHDLDQAHWEGGSDKPGSGCATFSLTWDSDVTAQNM